MKFAIQALCVALSVFGIVSSAHARGVSSRPMIEVGGGGALATIGEQPMEVFVRLNVDPMHDRPEIISVKISAEAALNGDGLSYLNFHLDPIGFRLGAFDGGNVHAGMAFATVNLTRDVAIGNQLLGNLSVIGIRFLGQVGDPERLQLLAEIALDVIGLAFADIEGAGNTGFGWGQSGRAEVALMIERKFKIAVGGQFQYGIFTHETRPSGQIVCDDFGCSEGSIVIRGEAGFRTQAHLELQYKIAEHLALFGIAQFIFFDSNRIVDEIEQTGAGQSMGRFIFGVSGTY